MLSLIRVVLDQKAVQIPVMFRKIHDITVQKFRECLGIHQLMGIGDIGRAVVDNAGVLMKIACFSH